MIKKGDKFIVLKYGTGAFDCIGHHMELVDEIGFCWFGKIGVAPSIKAIHAKLNKDKMYVILYCRGKAHLCDLVDVSNEKPDFGYPLYYENLLFGKGIIPKVYFKLSSITPMTRRELSKCVIQSSGKPMTETVSRSMASFFYAEYPEKTRTIEKKQLAKKRKEKEQTVEYRKPPVDINSCVYRKDGNCNNQYCVNYRYQCSRPRYCMKQKPVLLKR